MSRWLAALSFSASNVFPCRLSAVRSEFSRRSTVHRTFCAAATLTAGGVSADFRVTLLLGFSPFMVVRRRDRDDVVEAVADRDVLRRAAFVLVAALLRPPAALVGMVPGPSLRCDAGTSSPNLWAAILDDSRSLAEVKPVLLGHAAIINDRNKLPIADSEDDFEQSLRHSMTSGAATSHSAHATASSPFRRNSLRANGVDVALTAGM